MTTKEQDYREILAQVIIILKENLENDTFDWTSKYGFVRLLTSIQSLEKALKLIKTPTK